MEEKIKGSGVGGEWRGEVIGGRGIRGGRGVRSGTEMLAVEEQEGEKLSKKERFLGGAPSGSSRGLFLDPERSCSALCIRTCSFSIHAGLEAETPEVFDTPGFKVGASKIGRGKVAGGRGLRGGRGVRSGKDMSVVEELDE